MGVCKFFLQGECRFGESCRFEHQFPSGNIGGARNQSFPSTQSQNQTFTAEVTNEVDTNTLIKSVYNDMVSIERSGQWKLTCYAPFKEKQLFPGFQDQSFEEVRLGFYEAQKTNTFEQYKQQLQQALLEARTKFKALQTPSKEVIGILRSIYNTQVAPVVSNAQSSIFGNKATLASPLNSSSIFGQNAVTQVPNQSSSSIFGQNPTSPVFGQQNVTQTSGSIFGQQNAPQQGSGNLFGQQVGGSSGIFTGQQGAGFIFANANKNIFAAAAVTNNTNMFANAPQQTNLFQKNTQGAFAESSQNQPFGNSPNTFSAQMTAIPNAPFGQVPKENSTFQINSALSQPVAPSTFGNVISPQNPQFANPNTQSNSIFAQSPQSSNSVFNANSGFAPQQTQSGSVFNRLAQLDSTKSAGIASNSPLAGNVFGTGNNSINHDAYSKIEDLSAEDINWFKGNDLDVDKIPEKPPTYEMCFS